MRTLDPSGWYVQRYWPKVIFEFAVPCAAAALLFIVQTDGVNAWPAWKRAAVFAALAYAPFVNLITGRWAEHQRRKLQVARDNAETEARTWKRLSSFFSRLAAITSELVRLKGEEHWAAAKSDGRERFDQIYRARPNIDRIVAVTHRFVSEVFGEGRTDVEFYVSYFRQKRDNRGTPVLTLMSFFNGGDNEPRWIAKDEPHQDFQRDGRSTAANAWRNRRMVFVPDTQGKNAEGRFLNLSRHDTPDIGSIVAFPVFDAEAAKDLELDNGLLGVLVIGSSERSCFKDVDEQNLEFLLKTFGSRVSYEVRRTTAFKKRALEWEKNSKT